MNLNIFSCTFPKLCLQKTVNMLHDREWFMRQNLLEIFGRCTYGLFGVSGTSESLGPLRSWKSWGSWGTWESWGSLRVFGILKMLYVLSVFSFKIRLSNFLMHEAAFSVFSWYMRIFVKSLYKKNQHFTMTASKKKGCVKTQNSLIGLSTWHIFAIFQQASIWCGDCFLPRPTWFHY